jgi:hypothetical protein
VTLVEAKEAVFLHAGFSVRPDKPGFLGTLRPYAGLDESYFAEIVEAILVWHPSLANSSEVDRQMTAALWTICHRTRVLALRAAASIRHNKLMTAEELDRLTLWIDIIESMTVDALFGLNRPMCMGRVLNYIATNEHINVACYRSIIPQIRECLEIEPDDVVAQDVIDWAKRAIKLLT